MPTNSPTLTIVNDPVETAMGLLRDAGLDFTVIGETPVTVEAFAEAAAA